MDAKAKLDLALLPTDEILDELGRRYNDMIFCAENTPQANISDSKWKYKGKNTTLVGLCFWLGYRIASCEMNYSDTEERRD